MSDHEDDAKAPEHKEEGDEVNEIVEKHDNDIDQHEKEEGKLEDDMKEKVEHAEKHDKGSDSDSESEEKTVRKKEHEAKTHSGSESDSEETKEQKKEKKAQKKEEKERKKRGKKEHKAQEDSGSESESEEVKETELKEEQTSKTGSDSDSEKKELEKEGKKEHKKKKGSDSESEETKETEQEHKKKKSSGSDSESEEVKEKKKSKKEHKKKDSDSEAKDSSHKEPQTTTKECEEQRPLTLNEEERETFSSLFNMYAEEDGKIGQMGIKFLFRYMGELVSNDMVKQWLQEEDKNEDGKFDFDEFCHLYSKKREANDKRKEDLLVCVNRLFPAKGTSQDNLDLKKVEEVMRYLSKNLDREASVLTDSDIRNIISKMDKDNSKTVSRMEFVNFLCESGLGGQSA